MNFIELQGIKIDVSAEDKKKIDKLIDHNKVE